MFGLSTAHRAFRTFLSAPTRFDILFVVSYKKWRIPEADLTEPSRRHHD
jgi:hypothetical protein